MNLICPNCKSKIVSKHVNVSKDLTKCFKCNSVFKASELVDIDLLKKVNKPLENTRIEIIKDTESIKIIYPSKGLQLSHIPQFIILLLMISFFSFWTFKTIETGSSFAIFSILFWIIIYGMLCASINSIFESQTLILTTELLTLKRKRLIKSITINIQIQNLQLIGWKKLKTHFFSILKNPKIILLSFRSRKAFEVEIPTIIAGPIDKHFFEFANTTEQELVILELNKFVNQLKKTKHQQKE